MCAPLADFVVMVTCPVHACVRMMYLLTISEQQLHGTAMRLAAAECTFADHDHDHEGLEFGCDQLAVDRHSSSPGQHLSRSLSTAAPTLDRQTKLGVTDHATRCFTSQLAS